MAWFLDLLAAPFTVAADFQSEAVIEEVAQLEAIEVWGRRGAARIRPEVEIDAAEIDALSASDVNDVVRRLSRERDLGDAPLVIINGRRMADPGVFDRFPPDALVRVEILPPEASSLYGAGDPSRRVVNLVLAPHFESREGAVSLLSPTAGGFESALIDLRRSEILEDRTRQAGLRITAETALRGSDRPMRDVEYPASGSVTLRPQAIAVATDLALTRPLGAWSVSLRGGIEGRDVRAVSVPTSPGGKSGEGGQDHRQTAILSAVGGLNGDVAGWSAQLGLDSQLIYERQSGGLPSQSWQTMASGQMAASRGLWRLPAGQVFLNLVGRGGVTASMVEADGERRRAAGQTVDLTANLSLPLSRRDAENRGWGDATLSLGSGVNQSDTTQGVGTNLALAWRPFARFSLNGAWSSSVQGLSDLQRFGPDYYGAPVVVFDFLNAESVELRPMFGGNPNLRAPKSEQASVSASLGPFTAWRLQGGGSWRTSRVEDAVGPPPDMTPAIEAAFPDRVLRDADGRLIGLDRRPINYGLANAGSVSAFLNAAVAIGRRPRDRAGQGDVVRIGLTHTWQLRNVMTVGRSVPELDRLAGDGGGLPRRQIGLMIDAGLGAWSVNLAGRWNGGYRLRRDSGRNSSEDLLVKPIGVVDLGLTYRFLRDFAQGSDMRRGAGLQLEFRFVNLFDVRPAASRDDRPAAGYGRNDQDPVGRTVQLQLKQRF